MIMDEKFDAENLVFFRYLEELVESAPDLKDVLSNFPAYVGHVNLARFLSLYDCYKRVLPLSGDVGDFGTYKGGSFFTFAKLVKLFEPYSNTTVHGFDWFKGQHPGPRDNSINQGKYITSKGALESLIRAQGLDGLMKLHDLDLITELQSFLDAKPWMRFKLAFVDVGIENVLASVLPKVWDRIVPGGVLVLDHFNHEASPTESSLISGIVGESQIEQASYSRSPTAFIYKC